MKERWKKINGFEEYKISNLGNVKGVDGRILRKHRNNGTFRVSIGRKSKTVYLLVAEHFLKPQPDKKWIKFKDENKENISSSNLEWSYEQFFTKKTVAHRVAMLSKFSGKNHWKSKPFKIENDTFYTLEEASKKHDVHFTTIRARLLRAKRKDYSYIKKQKVAV